jgi:transposase
MVTPHKSKIFFKFGEDKLDAVWLAKVVERGMCRPSLVQPKPIRRLRDLTRYRRSLIRDQTREKLRLEKVLEDGDQ